MKQTILALIFAVMSVGVQAQTHLKFQGIPIDGTFAQFEAKLKAKGWVYDYEKSKKCPAYCRVYKGVFSLHEGELQVVSTPISKRVFSIRFEATKGTNMDIAKLEYKEHIEALRRVYPDAIEVELDINNTQFELDNGLILCGVFRDASYINYIDSINQQIYFSERDSDY